jgi:hypothetical protein
VAIVVWLLALGATVRLTRLLTDDSFPPSAWIRSEVGGMFGYVSDERGKGGKLYTLVTCRWCASMWIGAAVFAWAWYLGRTLWFLAPASVLVWSFAAGLSAQLEGGQPSDPEES